MTMYGYVRVSTKEQNEDRQMIAMREAGVLEENIFIDKQSGKDFNRPNYQKCIEKITHTSHVNSYEIPCRIYRF